MNIKRHPLLTFSDKKVHLATPYLINRQHVPETPAPQIFLHIPKCGGTTLHFIMNCCAYYRQKNYMRHIILNINPPVLINKGWSGAWMEAIEEFDPSAHYISGHFPFGIHTKYSGTGNYITQIRNPVEREISNFNHHFQKGFFDGDEHQLCKLITNKILLDNPQTRMLAGLKFMDGKCDDATYQIAIHNLHKHFSLFGTVEESHEFLMAILAINNWPAVAYTRAQISGIKAIHSLSDETTGILQKYHPYDIQLHNYASHHWREWKRSHIQGESLLNPSDPVIYLPANIHKDGKPALINAEQLSTIYTIPP